MEVMDVVRGSFFASPAEEKQQITVLLLYTPYNTFTCRVKRSSAVPFTYLKSYHQDDFQPNSLQYASPKKEVGFEQLTGKPAASSQLSPVVPKHS